VYKAIQDDVGTFGAYGLGYAVSFVHKHKTKIDEICPYVRGMHAGVLKYREKTLRRLSSKINVKHQQPNCYAGGQTHVYISSSLTPFSTCDRLGEPRRCKRPRSQHAD